MEKNREYKGNVLSIGSEGEGVIMSEGERAFVPFCLVGEEVSFKVLKAGDKTAYGKLTEVHTLSPDRAIPECPYFEKCGGCQLQHMNYSAQLSFKRDNVATCLKKLGGLDAEVGECVPSAKQYGYRNKLALPVGVDGEGENIVGFYAPRSHRIVPIETCALQAEWSDSIISSLLNFMAANSLKGYDEITLKGDIRHVVCREVSGKLVITVVAAHGIDISPLADMLDGLFKDYALWLNVNSSRGNVIFGEEWHVVKGEGYFDGEWQGIKFRAGANTFLQVNDDICGKLYSAVVAACADKDAVAIDLYSGGGLLTAMLAKACRAAYGVEIVPEAVQCAEELKKRNKLYDNMFNLCGAAEEKIDEVLQKTAGYRRVIVCDPPRKGMERSVVNAILKSKAEKVVMISCNPSTLARDAGMLCGSLITQENGLVKNPAYDGEGLGGYYKICSVTPFDMFPQTKHVETVVVLKRIAHGEKAGAQT